MEALRDGWNRWGCFATLGLALVTVLAGFWIVRRDNTPRLGADVRAVAFLDEDGKRHTLAEYAGKTVVVDVWATWCPPCKASLPELAALQAAADGRYAVLPISVDDGGFADVRAYLLKQPPAVASLRAVIPDGGRALEPFGPINGIPTTIIVGADGRLRARWSGFYPGRAEAELKTALGR